MERHKCKLCFRSFANGRALGGHMKAHLATLPLPPKTQQLVDRTESTSSSSSSSGEELEDENMYEDDEKDKEAVMEEEEKALVYGLRENPKKSFRLADPEFSFAVDAGSVIEVQDRESETESKNPTRRRSKRNRRPIVTEIQKQNLEELKKTKLSKPSSDGSLLEPEPMSSVSNTSPEEDVAMCLVMLSRDVWMRNNEEQGQVLLQNKETAISMNEIEKLDEIKVRKKVRAKHKCEICNKVFRSSQALCGHKKICYTNEAEAKNVGNDKIFECPFCYRVFGSGQALGGHKRSHMLSSSHNSATTTTTTAMNSRKLRKEGFIDLNLPAPLEDQDDFSVLSDA